MYRNPLMCGKEKFWYQKTGRERIIAFYYVRRKFIIRYWVYPGVLIILWTLVSTDPNPVLMQKSRVPIPP